MRAKQIKLVRGHEHHMKPLGLKPGDLLRVVRVTKPKHERGGWMTPAILTVERTK